jgi:hypothetical protein
VQPGYTPPRGKIALRVERDDKQVRISVQEALLVALTGWGQDQYRRRSHEAGFDRHMIKPANAEALLEVLNRC